MKKLVLFLLLLLPIGANADDAVEIDGIYYDFDLYNKTATVTYSKSNSYSGKVVIPSEVSYNGENYSVTYIVFDAFKYCSGLTSVTIPNSVTYILDDAFYGCI